MQKKSALNISLLLLLIIFLTSCEGMSIANGTVSEVSSNMPLDSVLCKVLETGSQQFTDSNGNYYLEGPFGPCFSKCKDMKVEFSKIGYKTKTVSNPKNEIIYLEK
ncbi:MAG: hypothetical protein ACEQSR_05210 [Candidatus Methylacidiphilales bacterium]